MKIGTRAWRALLIAILITRAHQRRKQQATKLAGGESAVDGAGVTMYTGTQYFRACGPGGEWQDRRGLAIAPAGDAQGRPRGVLVPVQSGGVPVAVRQVADGDGRGAVRDAGGHGLGIRGGRDAAGRGDRALQLRV